MAARRPAATNYGQDQRVESVRAAPGRGPGGPSSGPRSTGSDVARSPMTGGQTRRTESFQAHLPLPEPAGREPGSGELLAVLPGTLLVGVQGAGQWRMPDRARILTVLRRARDMCLRPWTRSRPGPAAAGRPHSGPRRAGPGQPRHAGPGEHITMPVIGGRILRVAMREGNPAWQPLLLCNGFGASLEMLQPFVDALDPRRAIIRFDMPGLGGSPAPVLPYHLATTAPLLSGILDQLGYQQADVLGISWGGGLAQQFALRCPARVRRLVLVATAPGALMVPGSPRILLRMLTPRRHQDSGYAARLAGELFGGSTREDPSSARDLLHAVTRPGPAR